MPLSNLKSPLRNQKVQWWGSQLCPDGNTKFSCGETNHYPNLQFQLGNHTEERSLAVDKQLDASRSTTPSCRESKRLQNKKK
mmetsp:Transcript_90832/g.161708  ORF Transcript_90832/g.161708 Transcript_90832/m.161708 type:complete len:82 (-) Transcript_90832:743-988(-)